LEHQPNLLEYAQLLQPVVVFPYSHPYLFGSSIRTELNYQQIYLLQQFLKTVNSNNNQYSNQGK